MQSRPMGPTQKSMLEGLGPTRPNEEESWVMFSSFMFQVCKFLVDFLDFPDF